MTHRAKASAGVRLWMPRVGVGLAGTAALLFVIAVVGAAYQQRATNRDLRRFPVPGRLVDVGGHRLHLFCQGSGEPSVILEAGFGDGWYSWTAVQDRIAAHTRACSYDRAGYGYSDPGPEPRDAQRVVTELRTLLTNAGVRPPYILVGHSIGGFYTRLYTYTFPSEVGGLVLVDPSNDDQESDTSDPEDTQQACRAAALAPFGIERLRGASAGDPTFASLTLPPGLVRSTLSPSGRERVIALGFRSGWYRGVCGEYRSLAATGQELLRARHALAIPLVVIDGNAGFANYLRTTGLSAQQADSQAALWHARHRQLAATSTHGDIVVAAQSGHYVQFDQPDLVVQTVTTVLTAVRAHGMVSF